MGNEAWGAIRLENGLPKGDYLLVFYPIDGDSDNPPALEDSDTATETPPPALEDSDTATETPPPTLSEKPNQIFRSDIRTGVEIINFDQWLGGTRYTRGKKALIWKNNQVIVEAEKQALGGSKRIDFLDSDYTLLVDGEPFMSLPITQTQWGQIIDYQGTQPRPLAHGWHILEIQAKGAEVSAPYPVFVDRGEGQPDYLPVMTTTQRMVMGGDPFIIDWVENTFQPVPKPLTPRNYQPFDFKPSGSEWFLEHISTDDNEERYPTVDDDGVVSVATKQEYYSGTVTDPMPKWVLLDGPRGVGTVTAAMHIEEGTASCPVTGGLVRNLYVLESHRFIKISPTGEIKTLFGWRSQNPPSNPYSQPRYDLVGDWSNIPEERHGIAEGWGVAWDSRTFKINEDADPIASERGMRPHYKDSDGYGVKFFVTDTLHHRILKIRASATSHSEDQLVEEWTLPDELRAWDIVEHPDQDGRIIASDRDNHRIVVLKENPETGRGEIVETLLEGQSNAYVTDPPARHPRTGGHTLSQLRAQPCVLPEGLYISGRWLYFGSVIQQQIRRLHLDTGVLETVVTDVPKGKNFTYLKIAVADGTNGPLGTVYVTNWTTVKGAGFMAFNPDGTRWNFATFGGDRLLWRGKGGAYQGTGYGSAIGLGNGRILMNAVEGGMREYSLALPEDSTIDRSKAKRGLDEWTEKGYSLTNGPRGYGNWFNNPHPWGESEDMDYFLTACGHKPQ